MADIQNIAPPPLTEWNTYTGGTCCFISTAFLPGRWWNLTAYTQLTPINNFVGSCSFEAQLPLPCTGAVVTILCASALTFSKPSSPELRIFLWHFLSDSCLKFIRTKKRRYSTLYLSRGILLHQWSTELHLLTTNLMIHSASLLSSTTKFTLAFGNRSLDL